MGSQEWWGLQEESLRVLGCRVSGGVISRRRADQGRVGPLGSPVYAVTSVGGPSPDGHKTLSHTRYGVAGSSPSSS